MIDILLITMLASHIRARSYHLAGHLLRGSTPSTKRSVRCCKSTTTTGTCHGSKLTETQTEAWVREAQEQAMSRRSPRGQRGRGEELDMGLILMNLVR